MLICLISICAAIVVYAAIEIFVESKRKKRVQERIKTLVAHSDIEIVRNVVLKEKKKKRKDKGDIKLVSRKFEDSLVMSGVKLSGNEFIIGWTGLTVIPMMILLLIGKSTVTAVAVAIIGFAIPPILVQKSKQKKRLLFDKQLGESLVIMSNCMKSGYSFQQAMDSVSKEMQPPISVEFARVVRELNYGVTIQEALGHMLNRVENEELNILVSAVLTSDQVGANLSEILDTISQTIKDRIKLREEIRVLSAQGRISGLIVGILPIALILLLMVINPGYINTFIRDDLGKTLLLIGALMEILGFLIIRKIIDIKY